MGFWWQDLTFIMTVPEDYSIRSQERTKLLKDIKRLLDNKDVYPAFWACCQVADLEQLKKFSKAAEVSGFVLGFINDLSIWILRYCKSRWKHDRKTC
jgi:hypothetical protein